MELSAQDTATPSLLLRVHARDADSCELLARIYGPIVYRWARQAGLHDAEASDLIQDVFLEVFRSPDVDRVGRFRRWLWRIFRSRLIDKYRVQQREAIATGGSTAHLNLQNLPDNPTGEDTDEGRSEQLQIKTEAILAMKDRFEPQVWSAFWRITVQGETPRHVAEDLGVSVWAVYKARSRCIARLQEELAGLDITLEVS